MPQEFAPILINETMVMQEQEICNSGDLNFHVLRQSRFIWHNELHTHKHKTPLIKGYPNTSIPVKNCNAHDQLKHHDWLTTRKHSTNDPSFYLTLLEIWNFCITVTNYTLLSIVARNMKLLPLHTQHTMKTQKWMQSHTFTTKSLDALTPSFALRGGTSRTNSVQHLGGPHSRSGNSEGENIFAYIPQSSH